MSKFNTTIKQNLNKTINCEGAKAYKLTPKMELISSVLTTFIEDSFYRSKNETLNNLKELILKINDPIFTAKLALYARTEANMRSVSHVLAGYLASMEFRPDTEWTVKKKHFFEQIIQRPDDMSEILAFYDSIQEDKVERSIPNALKKGFRKAFNKFTDYQISKYQTREKEWKLVDIVNVVKPIPQTNNSISLSKLIKDELLVEDTWEAMLSKGLQDIKTEEEKTAKKKQIWEYLITENKLPYMALLRNLRNILSVVSEPVLLKALRYLETENAILWSKVLPYRFYTAYKEIKKLNLPEASKVMESISNAADIALQNTPILEGKSLIVVDASGSMTSPPSGKSDMNMIEIASIFAASFYKKNIASHLMIFSNNAQYIPLNRKDTLLSLVDQIISKTEQAGTKFSSIFNTATSSYERIIILSDMQGMDGKGKVQESLRSYRERNESDPKIFNIDMSSYGTIQFPENKIYCITGWSDKMIHLIGELEKNPEALIQEIESIYL